METSEIKNAIISSVSLSNADYGLLTAYLHLDYGDGRHQGFGGYALYLPNSFTNSSDNKNCAGHFIFRCLQIGDVEEWSKLPGKAIRVKSSQSKIVEIGHVVKDDWFNPETDFNS